MKDVVVLITNSQDVHADAVESWLVEWDIPYFRFHPDELAMRYDINICHGLNDQYYKIIDKINKTEYEPSNVGAVWYRRAKAPIVHPKTDEESKNFFYEELSANISSFYASLNHAKWINKISDIIYANDKVTQLKYATKFGFIIPETIITNNQERAYSFYNLHRKSCVVKSFKPTLIGENIRIFTHKFHDNLSFQDFQSINAAPTMLQKFIPKKADIRVTVVGDDIFCCRIYSQIHEKTKVDFRCCDMLDLPHEIIELPSYLKKQIIDYAKFFNLISCELDFVEDENGELIFLECNPNGQWLWIEIMCKIDISKKLAQKLAILAGHNVTIS